MKVVTGFAVKLTSSGKREKTPAGESLGRIPTRTSVGDPRMAPVDDNATS